MQKILVTYDDEDFVNILKDICKKYSNFYFHFVSSKSCKFTSFEETKKLFEYIQPSFVIHLPDYSKNSLENIILINFNIVQLSFTFKINKLICSLPNSFNCHLTGYIDAIKMLKSHCDVFNENFNTNFICAVSAIKFLVKSYQLNLDDVNFILSFLDLEKE
jgi:hypothetical protein